MTRLEERHPWLADTADLGIRGVRGAEPTGGCDVAALARQQAAVRAQLGDCDGAIRALTVSVRHRPAGERRSRAITLARLAELQLDTAAVETARGTGQRFLQDYPHPRSRRVGRWRPCGPATTTPGLPGGMPNGRSIEPDQLDGNIVGTELTRLNPRTWPPTRARSCSAITK